MSEYHGRIYALKEIEKVKGMMVYAKVDSARYDVENFLIANEGLEMKSVELLKQAKDQLDTLVGFLQEFK